MNYSRNVRDKWLLLSTLDFSKPANKRLIQNIYNERIIDKLKEIRSEKPDYFKNINDVTSGMLTNKTSNIDKYKAYMIYSSQYVEMLHDFSLLNTSRKWKHNRYVGKYKVIFLNIFLKFKCNINILH